MENDRDLESRVLILAPTARDAQVTRSILSGTGLACVEAASLQGLLSEANKGVGAFLVTEECLSGEGIASLLVWIQAQPSWSDIPIVLLIRDRNLSMSVVETIRLLGNVTLLERPAPLRTVRSAVETAVRSRQRQYQIRDQIVQLREADEQKKDLLLREKKAREIAERANRMKDDFLATLSHELRTPLNAIVGWAHILNRAPMDEATSREGLTAIQRNANAQNLIISDLLDMNRIVSGKMPLELRTTPVTDVVQAAIDAVKPSAEIKKVALEVHFEGEISPILMDPDRLQQVIWNLLSNAIKFTPTGGRIEVFVAQTSQQADIAVKDNGQGINADFLPHVFERFRQADASTTRLHGGLGLGLSIAKHLVEMHGGEISAKSDGPGKGATFAVRIPIRVASSSKKEQRISKPPTSAPVLPNVDAIDLHGVRVLVVDDESDSRDLIRKTLEMHQAQVTTASSAAEGFLHLDRFTPDVIVSDIGMPEMDGYDFLKGSRRKGIQSPAIALTAFAREEDRAHSLQAGYQVHLAKPVEPDHLVTIVARAAGR